MKRTAGWIMRRAAAAAGAVTLLQAGTCDVQNPPANTQCLFGICIALPKAVDGDGLDGLEAAGEVGTWAPFER